MTRYSAGTSSREDMPPVKGMPPKQDAADIGAVAQ
jgi:hypothetical protein